MSSDFTIKVICGAVIPYLFLRFLTLKTADIASKGKIIEATIIDKGKDKWMRFPYYIKFKGAGLDKGNYLGWRDVKKAMQIKWLQAKQVA